MKGRSVIQSTRRGFLYQDMYAILCYLKNLLKSNIREFYVDYPLESNKSLDIRLIDSNQEELIYEVKSGDQFKEKKDEIIDAIENLHLYTKNKNKIDINLIIRAGFKSEISRYADAIQQLRRYDTLRTDTAKNSLKLLPILDSSLTDTERHLFYKKINVDDTFDDQIDSDNDQYPNIADQILSEIRNLMNAFDLKRGSDEWPDELLMHNLIYECLRHSGTSNDINSKFKKVIINFLIGRKFRLDHYKYSQDSGSPLAEEKKIRESIEEAYRIKFDQFVERKVEVLNRSSEGGELL